MQVAQHSRWMHICPASYCASVWLLWRSGGPWRWWPARLSLLTFHNGESRISHSVPWLQSHCISRVFFLSLLLSCGRHVDLIHNLLFVVKNLTSKTDVPLFPPLPTCKSCSARTLWLTFVTVGHCLHWSHCPWPDRQSSSLVLQSYLATSLLCLPANEKLNVYLCFASLDPPFNNVSPVFKLPSAEVLSSVQL